jgi:hypothetical protein
VPTPGTAKPVVERHLRQADDTGLDLAETGSGCKVLSPVAQLDQFRVGGRILPSARCQAATPKWVVTALCDHQI